MNDATRAERPPIEGMYMIHRVFRREFGMLPGLVRKVDGGDRRRAVVVHGHLRTVLAQLHLHHTSEDVALWPRLLDRARPSTSLIYTMEEQHHGVEVADARIRDLADTWTADPTTAHGEDLAQALEEMDTALAEHLDLEERAILPLVEQHITPAEWKEMTEHAGRSMPLTLAPILLGLTLEEATPAERDMVRSDIPRPMWLVLGLIGPVLYRRYIGRVRAA
jgi:hemerythrin-like domain-containing protein